MKTMTKEMKVTVPENINDLTPNICIDRKT